MKQRTYWHLEGLNRRPTEYEIATSRLLYYVDRGFEVTTPLAAWYARHQKASPLQATDWEAFADPRETTYAKYVDMQKRKELFVDGLFQSMEDTAYDRALSPEWVERLSEVLGPLRYALHGLQMAAAYVGSMAPSGRIVVAALFQAADEMRRIQRFAYRIHVLRDVQPQTALDARERWQSDAAWQPLREIVERLLVTYDWGEALVALNLAVKPAVDELVTVRFGRVAQESGDDLLARVLLSLGEDCAWHRAWTAALVQTIVDQRPANRDVIARWTETWSVPAGKATQALLPLLTVPVVANVAQRTE